MELKTELILSSVDNEKRIPEPNDGQKSPKFDDLRLDLTY